MQVWPLAHTANAAPAPQGHAFVDVSAVEDPTSLGRDSRCGPSDHHYHWSDRMAQQRLRFHPKAKRLRCAAPHSPPRNTGTHRHRPPAVRAEPLLPATCPRLPSPRLNVMSRSPPILPPLLPIQRAIHHPTTKPSPSRLPNPRRIRAPGGTRGAGSPTASRPRAPALRTGELDSRRRRRLYFIFISRSLRRSGERGSRGACSNPLPSSPFFSGHIRSRGAL